MAPTNLDLDTLRTLVTAYDLGGYGHAAARLGRTPSAVSLQMKRLQQDVGTTLFRKNGRKLALTEVGEIVLRYGRRMLDLNDEVLHTARGASLAGTVRLGCAQDFSEMLLPQVLLRFTKLYPLVQIELRIDKNVALARAVENKQLDLALTLGYSELRTARAVGELPLIWIAGGQFTWRAEQPLPLIMFDAPCFIRQRATDALDKAGIPWRIAVVSASVAGLWAAASAGLGVTVRTDFGLPAGLVAGATVFDLPRLGSVPVTLHKAADGPVAVERLAEIMSTSLNADFLKTNANHGSEKPARGKSRRHRLTNTEKSRSRSAKSAKLRQLGRRESFGSDHRSGSVLPAQGS
jgi:DNA-binding transcriptional LysR family regulator